MQHLTFTVLQTFTQVYDKSGFSFTDLHSLLRSVNHKAGTISVDQLKGNATPLHSSPRNACKTTRHRIVSPRGLIGCFWLRAWHFRDAFRYSPLAFQRGGD